MWLGLFTMLTYSLLLSLAGIFINQQDDAMNAGNVRQARKCRWAVQATLLASIVPFTYMVVHFKR